MNRFLFLALAFAALSAPAQAARLLTGSQNAEVQVLVYGDMQCPYTKKFMTYVERFEADFGARIGVLYAHFPLAFHEQAKPAAIAANCAAAQGRFRPFLNAAFEQQRNLGREFFLSTARSVGVSDMDAFTACLGATETAAAVEAEYASGLAVGVQGTPTIFVNGEKLGGVYPYEDFKKAIEKALKP